MQLNKYWLKIQYGDEKSLEALFKEINSTLCNYAYYLTGDQFAAEEIVQDVFLKIWQNRENIKLSGSLKSYLLKSVRNHSINYLLHKKTKKNTVNKLQPDESWQTIRDIIEDDDFIVEKLEAKDTEKKIKAIVDTLPEHCREVFLLSRIENKTNKEIALSLKISVNTVKTQIYRALTNIKDALNNKSHS